MDETLFLSLQTFDCRTSHHYGQYLDTRRKMIILCSIVVSVLGIELAFEHRKILVFES